MVYSKEELSSLNRKELQKLSKQFGIKANRKNSELVEDLLKYFLNLKEEEQNLEVELRDENTKLLVCDSEWISDDEDHKHERRTDIMKEVERRAQEKMTKIPRFQADKVHVPGQTLSPAKPFSKEVQRLDSIDAYLAKKNKRAQKFMNYHQKLKRNAEQALNLMKQTHDTPGGVKSGPNQKQQGNNTPVVHKLVKPSALVNKEVSFNFVSKLKTPSAGSKRSSPRLNALKERNENISKSNIQRKLTPAPTRKSVQFTNLRKPKTSLPGKVDTSKLNKTIGDFRSPGLRVAPTSAKKTPIKFNLQASLKKPLSYKPHTGKIKEVYFADQKSNPATQRCNLDKSMGVQKMSVKEITRNAVNRDRRREEKKGRTVKKRDAQLSRRRGLVC